MRRARERAKEDRVRLSSLHRQTPTIVGIVASGEVFSATLASAVGRVILISASPLSKIKYGNESGLPTTLRAVQLTVMVPSSGERAR
jgi:small-conductance mechanosensitive channel